MSRFPTNDSASPFGSSSRSNTSRGPRDEEKPHSNRFGTDERSGRFGDFRRDQDSAPTRGRFGTDDTPRSQGGRFDAPAPRQERRFDDAPRQERSERRFDDAPRQERSERRFDDAPRQERRFGDAPRRDPAPAADVSFSRELFGTASNEPVTAETKKNTSRPQVKKTDGGWSEIVPKEEKTPRFAKPTDNKDNKPKAKAGGAFASLDSEEDEELAIATAPTQKATKKAPETKSARQEPETTTLTQSRSTREEVKNLEPVVLGRAPSRATPAVEKKDKVDELFPPQKSKKVLTSDQPSKTSSAAPVEPKVSVPQLIAMKQDAPITWTTSQDVSGVGSFGGKKDKQGGGASTSKTAVSQLEKCVDGSLTTISLGQLKKNAQDIVPFPTDPSDGKVNFGNAIAKSIAQGEYSLNDAVTTLNKQFIDAYLRYAKKQSLSADDMKKVATDIIHQVFVTVVQELLLTNAKEVSDYFTNYTTEKLALFVPYDITIVNDPISQKQQVVEYFKKAKLSQCLNASDNSDVMGATVTQPNAISLDKQIYDLLSTVSDKTKAAELLKPKSHEIAAELKKGSIAFITAVFTHYHANKIATPIVLAFLDAVYDMGLVDYDMVEEWQNKEVGVVKREMLFKIGGWISSKKPQIQSYYDDEEDEEPFDDGF